MCAELEKTGVIGDNGVGIPILTGETGVGKTTAVEGLVQRIVRGAVDRRGAGAGSGIFVGKVSSQGLSVLALFARTCQHYEIIFFSYNKSDLAGLFAVKTIRFSSYYSSGDVIMNNGFALSDCYRHHT